MRAMQALRRARFLARFVLVWFALALGVAVASPLVKPQAMELVCSSAGSVKLVQLGDDEGRTAATPTLDCPLCLPGQLALPVRWPPLPVMPPAASGFDFAVHSGPTRELPAAAARAPPFFS